MPEARLWDTHCHTHYAYCRDRKNGVTALDDIRISRNAGLAGVVLTEHAGQLYLSADDFWGVHFQDDPDLIRRVRHDPNYKCCRMDAYLAEVLPLRDSFVRLGLEVDGDAHGGITLLDEDRAHWDILVGAVHWIHRFDPASATEAERCQRFMSATEEVLRAGVHTLAHPLRYFRKGGLPAPTKLYRSLAKLLAETGVAAEVNFHTDQPDPAFFAICLEHSVKFSLGTDAHGLHEVGNLQPHLDLLRKAGCTDHLDEVLFAPKDPPVSIGITGQRR